MTTYDPYNGHQFYTPPQKEVETECALCGEFLREGEEAVEYFEGRIGRGPKSGQPLVVEDPTNPYTALVFHKECLVMFLSESDEERLVFCSGCGAEIGRD